jgi:hypothetical protein
MPRRTRKEETPESTDSVEPADAVAGDFNPAELEAGAAPGGAGTSPDSTTSTGETTRSTRPAFERSPGRPWSGRFEQPGAYRRFTLKDPGGAEKIHFVFPLEPGETKPPEPVINVMRAHKYWKDGKPYGLADDARSNDESYPTGLAFGTNKKHPKAWVLPNDEMGRTVAESIDAKLLELGHRLEAEQGNARG